MEPLVGKLIDDEHRLAIVLSLLFLGGHLTFRHLDVVFLTELLEGIDVRALLDLHDKTDGISAHAAAEAFIDTLRRTDGKRTRLLVVERTETDEVRAALAQRDIVAHHLFDLGGRMDALYDFTWNHLSLCTRDKRRV